MYLSNQAASTAEGKYQREKKCEWGVTGLRTFHTAMAERRITASSERILMKLKAPLNLKNISHAKYFGAVQIYLILKY